jgi:urease accessory protein
MVEGELHLRFRLGIGGALRATVVDAVAQKPPLRFVRAFPLADGSALVHLHNLSGGVLSGDYLRTTVEVAAGARAQLTTTGATRIYRRRVGFGSSAGGCAVQETALRVESGALLEYLPDPVIPYAGSNYLQRTHIVLEQDAGLFAWDVITPGREAHGECFAYERLAWETLVTAVDGAPTPIAIERVLLEPSVRPLTALARLGQFRYVATFLACRVGKSAAHWSVVEQGLTAVAREWSRLPASWWGVSMLSAHGVMARGLGVSGAALSAALPAFWRTAKHLLYGEEAILPRKIYY